MVVANTMITMSVFIRVQPNFNFLPEVVCESFAKNTSWKQDETIVFKKGLPDRKSVEGELESHLRAPDAEIEVLDWLKMHEKKLQRSLVWTCQSKWFLPFLQVYSCTILQLHHSIPRTGTHRCVSVCVRV